MNVVAVAQAPGILRPPGGRQAVAEDFVVPSTEVAVSVPAAANGRGGRLKPGTDNYEQSQGTDCRDPFVAANIGAHGWLDEESFMLEREETQFLRGKLVGVSCRASVFLVGEERHGLTPCHPILNWAYCTVSVTCWVCDFTPSVAVTVTMKFPVAVGWRTLTVPEPDLLLSACAVARTVIAAGLGTVVGAV